VTLPKPHKVQAPSGRSGTIPARFPSQGDESGAATAAPAWITPALIDLTLRIWQPFYKKAQLTTQDAVQILLNVGRLFGAFSKG
jgi:hypothetical protein